MLVGINPAGELTGVIVTDHREPYGYFSVDLPEWPKQFEGKSIRDAFKVGTDVDAIRRATISVTSASRAMRNASRKVARAHLAPPAPPRPGPRPPPPRRPSELGSLSLLARYGAHVLRALLLCTVLAGVTSAQAPERGRRPRNAADAGWDFGDEAEEAPPTLLSLAREQALDIGLFLAFATLVMVSFLRKSVALKYVTLVFAVIYMGRMKAYMLSVVNVFGVLGGAVSARQARLPGGEARDARRGIGSALRAACRRSRSASPGTRSRCSPSSRRSSGAASTAAAYARSAR